MIELQTDQVEEAQKAKKRYGLEGKFALSRKSKTFKSMVTSSLNYGYNFVTKALQSSDAFVSFSEFKKIMSCLGIPMTLEDEAEFREYLISKELVKVERNDMLFDVDIKVDMNGLTELLKAKIVKNDPKANFDELQHFPDDAKALLNNIKNDLLESCLEDF
jgi:hypothetical protein